MPNPPRPTAREWGMEHHPSDQVTFFGKTERTSLPSLPRFMPLVVRCFIERLLNVGHTTLAVLSQGMHMARLVGWFLGTFKKFEEDKGVRQAPRSLTHTSPMPHGST